MRELRIIHGYGLGAFLARVPSQAGFRVKSGRFLDRTSSDIMRTLSLIMIWDRVEL